MVSVFPRFSNHFLIISIILECTSRLFNSTYFDTIFFERRFEGKSTKFVDQPGNLNVLRSSFTFGLYFLPFSSENQLCKEIDVELLYLSEV